MKARWPGRARDEGAKDDGESEEKAARASSDRKVVLKKRKKLAEKNRLRCDRELSGKWCDLVSWHQQGRGAEW